MDSDRGPMDSPTEVGPPSPGIVDPISVTDNDNKFKSTEKIIEEIRVKIRRYSNYVQEKDGYQDESDKLKAIQNALLIRAANLREQASIEELRRVANIPLINFNDCENKAQLLMKLEKELNIVEAYIKRAESVIEPAKDAVRKALDYVD